MKNKNALKANSNNEVLKAIDSLAIITKQGFDKTVSQGNFQEFKAEFKDFKKETAQNLYDLDRKVYGIDERIKRIEMTLEPLFAGYKIMQKEIQDLNSRLSKVEKKTGIKTK